MNVKIFIYLTVLKPLDEKARNNFKTNPGFNNTSDLSKFLNKMMILQDNN